MDQTNLEKAKGYIFLSNDLYNDCPVSFEDYLVIEISEYISSFNNRLTVKKVCDKKGVWFIFL